LGHAAVMTDSPAGPPQPAVERRSAGPTAAAVIALLAMVPVGFFYAASGLLVPGPWLYLMWLLYLALLWLAIWLARRGSFTVLVVPVAAAAAWWSVISLGEAYGGWSG
jgi:hypothetical protein